MVYHHNLVVEISQVTSLLFTTLKCRDDCSSTFDMPVVHSEGKPRRKDLIVLVAHNDDPTGWCMQFTVL